MIFLTPLERNASFCFSRFYWIYEKKAARGSPNWGPRASFFLENPFRETCEKSRKNRCTKNEKRRQKVTPKWNRKSLSRGPFFDVFWGLVTRGSPRAPGTSPGVLFGGSRGPSGRLRGWLSYENCMLCEALDPLRGRFTDHRVEFVLVFGLV